MPKLKNKTTGAIISVGVLPKQKVILEKEAKDLQISLGQLVRNKIFPKKSD